MWKLSTRILVPHFIMDQAGSSSFMANEIFFLMTAHCSGSATFWQYLFVTVFGTTFLQMYQEKKRRKEKKKKKNKGEKFRTSVQLGACPWLLATTSSLSREYETWSSFPTCTYRYLNCCVSCFSEGVCWRVTWWTLWRRRTLFWTLNIWSLCLLSFPGKTGSQHL